jgi:hypothetical protein
MKEKRCPFSNSNANCTKQCALYIDKEELDGDGVPLAASELYGCSIKMIAAHLSSIENQGRVGG